MGHLPFVFYRVRRSSSRRSDPASAVAITSPVSGLAMTGRRHDAKLQHFAIISGGRRAMAVTVMGRNDKLILESFQTPIFCSKTFIFQQKCCLQDWMI
jgi:hypothetical protein